MSTPWPIAPMRAVNTRTVPRGDDWVYEPKWDGHRVLVRRTDEEFDAVSSTGKPKLPQWRWLASAVAAATDHDVVVDGEVIAYDADGRHTFQSVGRADRQHAFVVFDLLVLDGADLRGRPWSERRELLEATVRPTPPLSITPVSEDADVMEAATRAQRFEGLIAKRASSTYQSGRRVPAWVKVKYTNSQEMVIGGYKLGEGNRYGYFGSLLVGVHDEAGSLQFVSAVGTGFNERTLTMLMAKLRQLETEQCPFAVAPKLPRGTYRWVRPELVAQVGFLEWTEGGGLRAPVFLGLRDDKPPSEVVRET
jgi:bifunctional non-homologous end joining protein LigD